LRLPGANLARPAFSRAFTVGGADGDAREAGLPGTARNLPYRRGALPSYMPSSDGVARVPNPKSITGTPDPIDVQVGEPIRAHRHVTGMSQFELGEQIGISFQQVQKYERGKNRVSASMLCHVARALNCRPQDLLPDQANDTRSPSIDAAFSLLAMPAGQGVVKAMVRLPTWAYDAAVKLVLDLDANTRSAD
jgi:transcriptional regulator with XRE-family HTH domain